MTDHEKQQEQMQEDEFECNIFAIKAEGIFRELTKMARMLFRRGYGTTQLIFSDWSFVSRTESGVISRVEALLRVGHKPLGFIAPDNDRERNPFVEPWELGDKAALAELRYLAHSIYWHLLPARNAQPHVAVRGNGGDHGK
jgi:hypothetical protein